MSHKSPKIAQRIAPFLGQEFNAHSLAYLHCFNTGEFHEAHDVLEELWLPSRGSAEDGFYKGLIQYAGAFVHLQKRRLGPAIALLKLSRRYLSPYAPHHDGWDLEALLVQGELWIERIEQTEPGGDVLSRFGLPHIPRPCRKSSAPPKPSA